MKSYRCLLLLTACALGGAANAQSLAIDRSLPGSAFESGEAIPPSVWVNTLTPAARPATSEPPIMVTLKREMTGQPVVAVGVDWGAGPEGGVMGREGQTLLSRLQDICEAFGTPGAAHMPFAVRGAWALAPATREEVNLDFTGLTTLDVAGGQPLLIQVLGRLNTMQARALASPQGLDVGGLPIREQAMVLQALRPPFAIARWKTTDTPGQDPVRTGTEVLATVTEPLNARGLRLRAQLRSNAPEFTRKRSGPGEYISRIGSLDWPAPPRPEIRGPEGGNRFQGQAEFNLLREVPNTYKPSDLDGAKVRQAIGVQGVFTVEQLLEHAKKATGLSLVASGQYRNLSVFVGSAALPTGDVLDAIRLSLTASWRKLGDTYVLAWDRVGLGVLQAMSVERAVGLRNAIANETQARRDADVWLTLAMQTPFAADDALGWTDAQRRAIFSPRPEQFRGNEWPPLVMFSTWTPAQQQAARARFAGKTVSIPEDASGEYTTRAPTEADFARMTLPFQARLELLVDLPGVGWCAMGDWWHESLDAHRVQSIRERQRREAEEANRKVEEEKRRIAEAERLAANPNAANPNIAPPSRRNDPHVLPPANRLGVMTPALPAESVAAVARLMAARGFETLFYPVLSGGYTSFPSKAFPPDPALGATDGWAGAVKAARENGLTLVGYVEALTWRRPGATNHWLERFPEYLDVDIAGRPLSESVANIPTLRGVQAVEVLGDMVRPRSSDVEKRLTTVMTEFMARPGASGVLLDAWSVSTALRSRTSHNYAGSQNLPRLGFAVPDRLNALKTTGVDPVDMAFGRSEFRPRNLAVGYMPMPVERVTMGNGIMSSRRPSGPGRDQEDAEYMALATKILPKARPDGAPWKTYAVATPPPGYGPETMPTAPPASTVLLAGVGQNRPSGKPISLMMRVRSRAAAQDEWRIFGTLANGWPAIAMCDGPFYSTASVLTRDLVVYDFRAAPDEILDSLRRVGLPE